MSPHTVLPSDRRRYLWLLIGGVLSLFALHTNWDLALAAWLFPIFLMRFTRTTSVRGGLGWTLLVSVVGAVFWLVSTTMTHPGIALVVIPTTVVITTVPFLADRLITRRLPGLLGTLVFPLTRTSCELLTVLVTQYGAVIGILGSTQHGLLPLAQLASVTGLYGISFVVSWLAPIANVLWEQRFSRFPRPAVVFAVVLTAILVAGGMRTMLFTPASETIRVAGVSPTRSAVADRRRAMEDIPDTGSFQDMLRTSRDELSSAFAGVADDLLAQTEREARAGAKVISWPEASVQSTEHDKHVLVEKVRALARRHGTYVDIGILVYTERAPYLSNQAVLVTPQGDIGWTYEKAHPTPMEISSGIQPGSQPAPVVDTPHGRFGGVICYDADYPKFMRQADVDLMLVPTNDWRGFERLHAQKSVFRAIENGYSLLRQASNGVALAVDNRGRVLARNNHFATADQTMVAVVPTQQVLTIYRMVGDLFAWLCVAAALALVVGAVLRRPRSSTHNAPGNTAAVPAPGQAPKGAGRTGTRKSTFRQPQE